jgi:hypothetical protein
MLPTQRSVAGGPWGVTSVAVLGALQLGDPFRVEALELQPCLEERVVLLELLLSARRKGVWSRGTQHSVEKVL